MVSIALDQSREETAEAAPLSLGEFAELMQRFAPFEPSPHLAVAVSGGADSLALTLLADDWARANGGTITALTVDHRLRAQSAAEAAQVGAWLARRGIAHRILTRPSEPSGTGGIQAAARAARYALLEEWCRAKGVLHLLLAHHREDQAETLLLRLARGSGLAGLAAMAGVFERADCRLLRPLLGVPRARLVATLSAIAQPWIEDPSNHDRAYARVRLRKSAPALTEAGLTPARLAATAARLGKARVTLEAEVATLLAAAVEFHPAGFARLDQTRLTAAPAAVGRRGLAAVLGAVGGAPFAPRSGRLDRLYDELCQELKGGRTLGGCRLLPHRGGLLVCREAAAMAPSVALAPGTIVYWDGRFRLYLAAEAPQGLFLGALGAAPVDAARRVPGAVRPSLAALSDKKTVVAVPALGYRRADVEGSWLSASSLSFRPTRPLTGASFTVV
ncbi:MAG TPA: tRNA lysidine(34) synthetase TilS [Stellaceae bacterium]|nr:tRNA lysidine(34) synthetase TilS [Stellaceae bacterium]